MTSLPAEATKNVIQASVQKEIPTAGNVEGIAPGGTQNNATAELRDASETRHIDANKEAEDSDDNEGSVCSDDESDSDIDAEEIDDDAPPIWGGYGARAPVKHTVAGPKGKPPTQPIKPPAKSTEKS